MSAAFVELPEDVLLERVERAYMRARQHQQRHQQGPTAYTTEYAHRGERLARVRDARVLKFLDRAAEQVWKWQQWQLSGLDQAGHAGHRKNGGEYTEASTWKEAFRAADEQTQTMDNNTLHAFRWIYGACAEAVYGSI